MKPIAIFLNFSSSGGGIFQYAIALLDALYLSNYPIIVFYNRKYWHKELIKYKDKFELKTLKHPKYFDLLSKLLLFTRSPKFLINIVYEIFNPDYKLMKRLDCEFWIYPYPDITSYQSGFKYIAAIHDLMHIYLPNFRELSGFFKSYIRNERFKKIIEGSESILVDSSLGKIHLKNSFNIKSDKIKVLPFVPPSYIQENSKVGVLKINSLNLPKRYIFYPAKFWSHKNHLKLLKSINIAKKRCPNIHFVFTGNKKYDYWKIIKEINKLSLEKEITILGEIDSALLPSIYRNAIGLFMPTFGGPTNIPPLEAILCKCPMAVSNNFAMPEQLKQASLYFDPSSEDEMANVIFELWTNEKKRLEIVAEGIKLKKFISIESHKNRIINILNDIK